MGLSPSDMKTLPTATSALFVGIVKNELTPQLILHVIHFGAHQGHQCFAINDKLELVVCNHLVEFSSVFDVVHGIAEAVASLLGETDLDADLLLGSSYYFGVILLLHERQYSFFGGRCLS